MYHRTELEQCLITFIDAWSNRKGTNFLEGLSIPLCKRQNPKILTVSTYPELLFFLSELERHKWRSPTDIELTHRFDPMQSQGVQHCARSFDDDKDAQR